MIPGDVRYFIIPTDDAEIRRRIEIPPQAIANLAGYEISEGASLIESRMKAVYTATPQTIRGVRKFCGIGLDYLKATYNNPIDFVAKCNQENLVPADPRSATALTGLGGVGKTQLLRAISRLVTPVAAQFECPGLPVYPVQAMWILTMVSGLSLRNLLEPLVGSGGSLSAMLIAAAKRAFTNGIGLSGLDESQFITLTEQGHAKAAGVLMRLTYMGPPLVYAANFTMINKLDLRPQQEKDRLLSNVTTLYPEAYGSDAFQSILSDQLVVLAEAVSSDSSISAKNHAHEIHNYTYGINRKSAFLLKFAWEISRERGSSILTMDDIQSAYNCAKYTSHRNEVEILKEQDNNKCIVREDLWCDYARPPVQPLLKTPPAAPSSDTSAAGNVVDLPSIKEEKEKRIADEMARETMSKAERDAYDILTNRAAKSAKSKAPVLKISKDEMTLAALQKAGAEMLARFAPRT